MSKIQRFLIGIWGLVWYICTWIGIVNIVHNSFIAICFTTGCFISLLYLLDKEQKEETRKTINEVKTIYSLDYSKLKNIKRIELTEEAEYYMILDKNGKEFEINLNKQYVPKNQEMLVRLDGMWNNTVGKT